MTTTCLFTVFTATYNRASTLPRVYESLKAQTFRDFEWIIVDDGSADGTAMLVKNWQAVADFPVRYFYQENGGKHKAINRGLLEARGALFLSLDSDDSCVPTALERFKAHWDRIEMEKRTDICGITALCHDQNGKILGDRFPFDQTDSDTLEIRYRYKVKGEKWSLLRTEVAKKFPYPGDFRGRYFPEDIISSEMARNYKTRFINEPLRTYYQDNSSLCRCHPKIGAHERTVRLQYVLTNELDWFWRSFEYFWYYAAQYIRFSCHLGQNIGKQFRALPYFRARLAWVAALPLGILLYINDNIRFSGQSA
ncbi:MAG: glycosyltransferase family 2 protein [Cyanobacteria bacterium NC_groundwater_1444_Ag_S-0.65um_54_12]|nr:glycosyltransferase family 2 protein [Cyanobacteria bacterium NC_groundwater_1444_Ag_S-0.65um_54_12]